MHSLSLQEALTEFVEAAATRLQSDVLGGAEVPFEVESQATRRGAGAGARPLFYSYRAMTGQFIAERQHELERLPSYAAAARALSCFDGLDRYLASVGVDPGASVGSARIGAGVRALLRDVFNEQSDFELHPERLADALGRLEQATIASAGSVMLVATLHGLLTTSPEVALTRGLTIAHRRACWAARGCGRPGWGGGSRPPGSRVPRRRAGSDRRDRPGREVLKDLLRALRLFGDGRVTLGLWRGHAWARAPGTLWRWERVVDPTACWWSPSSRRMSCARSATSSRGAPPTATRSPGLCRALRWVALASAPTRRSATICWRCVRCWSRGAGRRHAAGQACRPVRHGGEPRCAGRAHDPGTRAGAGGDRRGSRRARGRAGAGRIDGRTPARAAARRHLRASGRRPGGPGAGDPPAGPPRTRTRSPSRADPRSAEQMLSDLGEPDEVLDLFI